MHKKIIIFALLVSGLLFSIRRMSPDLDAFVYVGSAIAIIIALLGQWDMRKLKSTNYSE